jgi:hypothetical protein
LLTISEECKALGADLVSLKQNLDTTLPAGRLTFQLGLSWIVELSQAQQTQAQISFCAKLQVKRTWVYNKHTASGDTREVAPAAVLPALIRTTMQ